MNSISLDLLRYEFFSRIPLSDLICLKSVCTLWCHEIEQLLDEYWAQLLTENESDPRGLVFRSPIHFLNVAANKIDLFVNAQLSDEEKKHLKATICFIRLFNFCDLTWNTSLTTMRHSYLVLGLRVKLKNIRLNDPQFSLKDQKLVFEKNTRNIVGQIIYKNEFDKQKRIIVRDLNRGVPNYYIESTWWGLAEPKIYDRNNQLVDISFDIKTFEDIFPTQEENSQTCCGCLNLFQ